MLFDPSNPDAFWLDVTNAALGVFCLVCLLAIGWAVWQDLAVHVRRRSFRVVREDPHAHFDPLLGPSMADGGEPLSDEDRRETESESERT